MSGLHIRQNQAGKGRLSGVYSIILLLAVFIACSPNLENRVDKFGSAINSGDVSRVMSFYADTVEVGMGGASTAMGEVQLRQLAQWDSIVNTHVHFTVTSIAHDTVICKKWESNEWYRAFGIDTVYFNPWVFVFKDEHIIAMKQSITPESAKRMSEAYEKFYSWAYANRPRKLKELMPEGRPIYGPLAAKKWMELLKEWRQETEAQ